MFKTKTITIKTTGFCDIINITDQALDFVKKSGVKEGLFLVFIPGSTAGITTIEYEEGLILDLKEIFEKLVPSNKVYHHDKKWGDGNGFSHVRASLLGPSLVIPIQNGNLSLGTWQQIVVCDFDNRPRVREVILMVR
jgi:secondary thiamine-phosphate synthase enzyme